MKIKRITGFTFIIISLILSFLNFSFTGAAIGINNELNPAFIVSLALLIMGIIVLGTEDDRYRDRESKLKRILGEKFAKMSEQEKIAYNKAFRRHEKRVLKNELYNSRVTKEKPKYLDNEAAEFLQREYYPIKRRELIRLAVRCGYRMETGAGYHGGQLIYNDKGEKITEITNHDELPLGVAKKILKALATGKSQKRKTG